MIKMVSRAKRNVPSVALSELNRAFVGLRNKLRTARFMGKQPRHLRSIWSLLYYSCWRFRPILVRVTKLAKETFFSDFGSAMSSAGHTFTGRHFDEIANKTSVVKRKIGTTILEVVSFSESLVGRIWKTVFFSKSESESLVDGSRQPKTIIQHESQVQAGRTKKPILTTQEYGYAFPSSSAFSSNSNPSAESPESLEIAAECLTCENLIRCDFRGNLSRRSERQALNHNFCNFANRREIGRS